MAAATFSRITTSSITFRASWSSCSMARRYPARVLQFDPVMDLAIIKVDPDHSLAAIKVGTSSDLMVGETVITIGNAYGYENTVSVGIVSALHRDVTLSDEQVYRNLIQTDACINPGNSGGPLINVDGELIGINVAVRAGAQGIGFALPIDEVKQVAADMISSRRLASTWHGLVAGEQRSAARRRVVVSEVQSGSPAEAAGFKAGRRAGPRRRPAGRELAGSRARNARRASWPSRPGGDSPRQHRDDDAPRRPHRSRRRRQHGPGRSRRVCLAAAWESRRSRSRTEYVASVSPKLRGGLYIQSVSPGSLASQAAIQQGDILVGMNVGTRHWETIRADNILYVLRQPEMTQTNSALLYVVRRNGIQPRRISFAESALHSILGR